MTVRADDQRDVALERFAHDVTDPRDRVSRRLGVHAIDGARDSRSRVLERTQTMVPTNADALGYERGKQDVLDLALRHYEQERMCGIERRKLERAAACRSVVERHAVDPITPRDQRRRDAEVLEDRERGAVER